MNVIVKHVQHVRILWASCLLRGTGFGKFFNVWRIEKIAGLWFAKGISTQTDTVANLAILTMLGNMQSSSEKGSSYPSRATVHKLVSTCQYYKYILGSC